MDFRTFFRDATGFASGPYGYQERVARDGFPDVLEAPTGTGKTAVILAWLWRRLFAAQAVRDATPRRLIYALPLGSLVDQTEREVRRWLENLSLADEVPLHVVMGGRGESQGEWRLAMHEPAVVIGTVDSLVSKLLNRGYGISRATYPIDLGLTGNGAMWIIDEIQLCAEATTTLRQLAAFASAYGTAEPFGLTCMSATVRGELLATIDNPAITTRFTIEEPERTGALFVRLAASRVVRKLDVTPGDPEAIARAALTKHRPGHLTLVVLNTVEVARNVYLQLRRSDSTVDITLLHSRFRGIDRAKLMDQVVGHPQGRIVVATQVVEAGIDLNAAVLITEAAPWPSIVQRAGRCNRTGTVENAEMCWLPPGKPAPYEQEDIDATVAALTRLGGTAVTSEDLRKQIVPTVVRQVAVIRRPDFAALFDTSPDLSGSDIDVAPYIRDAEDLDVQLAWVTWSGPDGEPGSPDQAPPADAKAPAQAYRCRVPAGRISRLAADVPVWRFDQVTGVWTRIGSGTLARPGEILLIHADHGRYDPETGFDLSAKTPVRDVPHLSTKAELAAATEDAFAADSSNVQQKQWQSLGEHSDQVRAQAASLFAAIQPELSAAARESAIAAAYLHDAGKAHPIWQDALCKLPTSTPSREIEEGRPWAKSDSDHQLRYGPGNTGFRHELASLLLLGGSLKPLLDDAPDPDLVRYLVLAHHGKLRTQVRDPGDLAVIDAAEASHDKILGLQHGTTWPIPAMLGQPESELTVTLDQFRFGSVPCWTDAVVGLLERYGPFRLAYLEAIVRVADWRASKALDLAR